MTHPVGRLGRLRIETRVWLLDQQIYDLPRRTRITVRQEVRANLLDAARVVGAGQALRRLGGSRRLAEQYLRAEFGDEPRRSWIAAAYTAGLIPLALNFLLAGAAATFERGVTAADPHATGSFVWAAVGHLQRPVTFAFTDGQATSTGGAWTPLTYALWLLAVIVAGRLWRLPRLRRRGRASAATA
ncbi:hypothetical protein ACWKSP_01570 [Micromonosporaceae bacterium Da 78-11]